MFIVHFLLLLAPLIFFHELGHFLFARWMGVRVLSFSIGFGPVLFAWRRGPTEYAIRALPLGGYVRMHGDDPSAVAESDEPLDPDSFAASPVWRRTLIIAAGPIANLILPVVILFSGSLIGDGEVVGSRIGSVDPGGPAAAAGLRTGDRITQIDGIVVDNFADLQREISKRPGVPTPIVFERLGESKKAILEPEAYRDVRLPELGMIATVGRIQVRSHAQSALVSIRPDSPAWRAGLRSGWLVRSVDGQGVRRFYDFERATLNRKGQSTVTLEVSALKPLAAGDRKALKEAAKAAHEEGQQTIQLVVPAGASLAQLGVTPAETLVGFVEAKTPAHSQAGLKAGDEILAVDGEPVTSFFGVVQRLRKTYDDARIDPANRGLDGEELLAVLQASVARPHTIRYRRLSAQATEGYVEESVQVRLQASLDRNGRPALSFGAGPLQRYEDAEMVVNHKRLEYAWDKTWTEMGRAVKVTLLTVAGLFKGDVPMREVGGPIFMAQLAARTSELGWGYFFHLMVWISVNLAILNLLPIPLVDGGHLLFLAIEAVKREPVSLRTRMIASYVGMTFIGLLFVVVMKNDIQRQLVHIFQ